MTEPITPAPTPPPFGAGTDANDKAGSPPRIRIAILGLGIAGTCLATGLISTDGNPRLDIRVFEAQPTPGRVRGSGLALHGNAIAAMDCLAPALKRAYFRSSHYMADEAEREMATQVVLAAGATGGDGKAAAEKGEVVAHLGKAKGRRTVHRAHLIEGLLEEEPAVRERVVFGRRVTAIRELSPPGRMGRSSKTNDTARNSGGVEVVFADGTAETFDAVLGAEGVHSVTRPHVLGCADHPAAKPVNHDSWRCFNRHVPMDEARRVLPPQALETVSLLGTPLGYAVALPVDLGRTLSVTCTQKDSNLPPAERGRPFVAERWRGFTEEVDGLVELLKHDPREHWTLRDHDHAPTYARGRVAVLGDAAHATMPHAGNGAAQAIEDAAVLAGILARVTDASQVPQALGAYDAVRRPRSQRVVDITREFGRLYSQRPEDIDVDEMRRRLREGGLYTNGVDMQDQVRRGVRAFERLCGVGAACAV
ncbi:FAD/NAD(P)-binding domain-containing protein [Xylariomycetidae sp. FL0641]|nr:FAD/NAD(P)-binding domain-containing protein [Xylariomycetidae sp. FL0641]